MKLGDAEMHPLFNEVKMAYKRTTRKTGASSRSTTTYNTKTGKTTQSQSTKLKGTNHRITQSSSNGTLRITNTYTDPSGYITKESHTLGETNTQRKRRQSKEATANKKRNKQAIGLLGLIFGALFKR